MELGLALIFFGFIFVTATAKPPAQKTSDDEETVEVVIKGKLIKK